MSFSINSLQNMEYMLYGGALGANPSCPSFVNGYKAADNWNYMYPYQQGFNSITPYQNLTFGDSIYNTPQAVNTQSTTNNQIGFGSSADMQTLADYYVKGSAPSESLSSAAVGGAAFALVNNTRFIAHPWNSLSSIKNVEKMFAEVKRGGKLEGLWTNPDTHKIMTDAYHKMHKLEGASKSRLGMFKAKIDKQIYDALKAEMEAALKSGDAKKIATVTEKIRVATGAKTGWLPKGWRKLWCKDAVNVADKIKDTKTINSTVATKLAEKTPKTIGEYVKRGFKSQGVKGGLLFGAMEFLMDFGKIQSAFSKDSSTGAKQLGQTSVKAAGSIIGWTVGEAVGAAAGAKIGAAIGTVACPGLGTAIGAVAGLIGGSIGTWAMGKLTKAIVGEDVGSKAEAEKLTKTKEGQAQLLELTMQQAQEDLKDKKLDPKVVKALQNVVGQYSAVA